MCLHGSGFLNTVLLLTICVGPAAAQSASFQTPVPYATQKGSVGLVTADFNGDGKLDLAVSNAGSSSVSVLLGKGDGTFTTNGSTSIPNSCNAIQLFAGDFNNDGNQDVLVVCAFDAVVWFLPGTGKGQFGTPVSTALPAVTFDGFFELTFQTAAVEDFNGDGNLDLVLSLITSVSDNQGSVPLDIFLGNGDGTFQAPTTILSGTVNNGQSATVALNVAAADLDGDGTPDLVVSAISVTDVNSLDCETDTPNAVLLTFHGNGDGTFQMTGNYSFPDSPILGTLIVSDVNGDGIPDIVVGGVNANSLAGDVAQSELAVYLGTGGGNFKPGFTAIENDVITQLLAGDFRGAGMTDLLEVALENVAGNSNSVTESVSIRAANGDGTFQNPVILSGAADTNPGEASVIEADWNGDGLIDIAFPSNPQFWSLLAADNNANADLSDIPQFTAVLTSFYQSLPQSTVDVMLNSGTPPPVLTSVQNPGSNILLGLPNYGIGQGSVFVVYGEELSSSNLTTATALPYITSMANTSITVTVGGTTVNCFMVYTYRGQVAAILPSNTPVGTGTLTLTYDGKSGSIPITVIAAGFGILSQNETGVGPAVATHADNTPITNTNAAFSGEQIVIWGTGLGPLPAGVSDASSPLSAGANIGNITVYVGGVAVTNVAYHGRNPSDPGLDQINIQIPAGVVGCYVSLVVQSGNYVSNTTTLAIAPSQGQKTCSDTNGISMSGLSNSLSTTGSATIGTVVLNGEVFSSQLPENTGEGQGAVTPGVNATSTAEFEKYTELQLNEATAVFPYPSVGSCTVSISNSARPAPVLAGSGKYAGKLSVTVPGGTALGLISRSAFGEGYYSNSQAVSSLPAGSYQVAGSGASGVGSFTASLNSPANVTWTNQTNITGSAISRTSPLAVTWSGGDASGSVLISGTSSNPTSAGVSIGATFTCLAPASEGSFTVPTSALLSLPASASGGNSQMVVGGVSVSPTFSVTGLSAGYLVLENTTASTVTWK